MTRPDLDALEKLADEATPGPWQDGPAAWFRGRRSEEDGKRPIQRPGHPGTMANVYGKENAAFIAAANPATIKALIAEVRSLQARVARWEPPMMTSTASSSCSAFLARNGKGEG